MERDFMGLMSKDSLVVVKEEITENPQESGAHWAFMRKMSAVPQFLSFGTGRHDRTTKMEVCDQSQKVDMQLLQRGSDMMMSVSNQSLSPNTSLQPGFASCGQNLAGATLRQQLLSIPLTISSSNSPIIGVTEPGRSNLKACAGPAQMTIFYAGTVSVYDDLSPEKAQAIMLLAGNNSSFTNVAHSRPPVQAPTAKLGTSDAMIVNQLLNLQPAPGLSSPLPVPSHSITQPGSDSKSCDKLLSMKTTGVSTTSVNKPEPQRVFSSGVPISVAPMVPAALPLARKASLLRFLEKRKERVMNTAPYFCEKKPQEEAAPRNDASQSASSAANSASQ